MCPLDLAFGNAVQLAIVTDSHTTADSSKRMPFSLARRLLYNYGLQGAILDFYTMKEPPSHSSNMHFNNEGQALTIPCYERCLLVLTIGIWQQP